MFGTHELWLFVLSGLLLNVTPGPDTMFIVGRSTSQGWPAGAMAALGVGSGVLVHVLAASLGLSALLAASATAFMVVKWIGAAYLVYVGVSLLRSAGARRAEESPPTPPASMRAIYLQGLLTNVLNPKVGLFFLAFLPQFVAADAPMKAVAFVFLGLVFDINGTLWNLAVAWSSARVSARFAGGGAFKRRFERGVGTLFIGVGIKLALSHDP